jgi:hypothetical protein
MEPAGLVTVNQTKNQQRPHTNTLVLSCLHLPTPPTLDFCLTSTERIFIGSQLREGRKVFSEAVGSVTI